MEISEAGACHTRTLVPHAQREILPSEQRRYAHARGRAAARRQQGAGARRTGQRAGQREYAARQQRGQQRGAAARPVSRCRDQCHARQLERKRRQQQLGACTCACAWQVRQRHGERVVGARRGQPRGQHGQEATPQAGVAQHLQQRLPGWRRVGQRLLGHARAVGRRDRRERAGCFALRAYTKGGRAGSSQVETNVGERALLIALGPELASNANLRAQTKPLAHPSPLLFARMPTHARKPTLRPWRSSQRGDSGSCAHSSDADAAHAAHANTSRRQRGMASASSASRQPPQQKNMCVARLATPRHEGPITSVASDVALAAMPAAPNPARP